MVKINTGPGKVITAKAHCGIRKGTEFTAEFTRRGTFYYSKGNKHCLAPEFVTSRPDIFRPVTRELK